MKKDSHKVAVDYLKTSPMFQLSLSSKELFHTNFLYWLWQISPVFFQEIIKRIDSAIVSNWPTAWEVRREYHHYDLCVTDKDGKEIFLILENKVKSIPDIKQLDKYWDETQSAFHILLSLPTEFPNRNKIESEKKWKIISYHFLGGIIFDLIKEYKPQGNTYFSRIIKDYSLMVHYFHLLQNEWNLSNESNYLYIDADLEALRINDVKEKIRCSMVMDMLQHRIENELNVVIDNDTSRDHIFSSDADLNKVYINWGMTRAQGFIEVKILASQNIALLVQIQGNQYRHAIELKGTKKSDKENWDDIIEDNRYNWFFQSKLSDSPFLPFDNSDSHLCVRPESSEYNKYGAEFLYQYITIPANLNVGQLLDIVVNDCKRIYNLQKSE